MAGPLQVDPDQAAEELETAALRVDEDAGEEVGVEDQGAAGRRRVSAGTGSAGTCSFS